MLFAQITVHNFVSNISFLYHEKNIPPAVDHFSQVLSNLFAFILFYVYLQAISYRDWSFLNLSTACVYQSTRTKFRGNSDVFTGFDEDIDSE